MLQKIFQSFLGRLIIGLTIFLLLTFIEAFLSLVISKDDKNIFWAMLLVATVIFVLSQIAIPNLSEQNLLVADYICFLLGTLAFIGVASAVATLYTNGIDSLKSTIFSSIEWTQNLLNQYNVNFCNTSSSNDLSQKTCGQLKSLSSYISENRQNLDISILWKYAKFKDQLEIILSGAKIDTPQEKILSAISQRLNILVHLIHRVKQQEEFIEGLSLFNSPNNPVYKIFSYWIIFNVGNIKMAIVLQKYYKLNKL